MAGTAAPGTEVAEAGAFSRVEAVMDVVWRVGTRGCWKMRVAAQRPEIVADGLFVRGFAVLNSPVKVMVVLINLIKRH